MVQIEDKKVESLSDCVIDGRGASPDPSSTYMSFDTALVDCTPTPVLITRSDATVEYANEALMRHTGFTHGEIIGAKPPHPWWTDDTRYQHDNLLKQLGNTDESRVVIGTKWQFQNKDGQPLWVDISVSKVMDGNKVTFYLTTWVDITQRIEEEKTVLTLINSAADSEILIDLNYQILAINKKGALLFNQNVDELVGHRYLDFVAQDLVAGRRDQVKKVLSCQRTVDFTDEHRGIVYRNRFYPVFNTRHEIFRLALVTSVITQRVLTEKRLRSSFNNLISDVMDSTYTGESIGDPLLSTREKMVVQMLADGNSTKEIAMALGLSQKTIETHRARAIRKLGIGSLADLVKYAIRQGLTGI